MAVETRREPLSRPSLDGRQTIGAVVFHRVHPRRDGRCDEQGIGGGGGGFRSARSLSLSTSPENIQSSTASSNRTTGMRSCTGSTTLFGVVVTMVKVRCHPVGTPRTHKGQRRRKRRHLACGTRSACGHPFGRRSRLPARRSAASARRHSTPVSLPGSPLDR